MTTDNHRQSFYLSRKINSAWIGYNDLSHEGKFNWIKGSGRFTNWMSGEPNGGKRENCGVIVPGKRWGKNFNGRWNDIRCDSKVASICEKPSK